jgi:hypothetical protein
MTHNIKRRPPHAHVEQQPFAVSSKQSQAIKEFNKGIRYVQGFLSTLTANSNTTVNMTLFAAGKMLLGVSIVPVTGSDITNTQITFLVNNNNLLNNVGSQNLNPNYVQGMIYFPLPQPLIGNDNIQANFTKNDAGSATVTINIFYVPRI